MAILNTNFMMEKNREPIQIGLVRITCRNKYPITLEYLHFINLLMDNNGFSIMFAAFICAFHFYFSLQWIFSNNHSRTTNRTGFFIHINHTLELNDILIINSILLPPRKRNQHHVFSLYLF